MPEPNTSDMADAVAQTPATEAGNRFQLLGFEQVNRLHRLMDAEVPIHGRGNFPTLQIKLRDLVQVVRNKLKEDDINVRDIRLNGGAASFILGNETSEVYNDLDLIFGVDLSDQSDLKRVKDVVVTSLLNFMPAGVCIERMSGMSLSDAYVRKLVKVYDDVNRWSLISLSNVRARNVELKFADRMRRQFEFSVDSFQIILDSLLTFYDVSRSAMTQHFYPTVVAESVYGSFDVAIDHLNHRLIATRNPEEIRGGGLLKYCNLVVRRFRPTRDIDVARLERYMCSRFFIDFPDVDAQRTKLEHYLADHFSDDLLRHEYLATLWTVINTSTVCLMGHERRLTLSLIANMARAMLDRRALEKGLEDEMTNCCYSPSTTATLFDQSAVDLVIDQVYYGPFCCPPVFYPNPGSSSCQPTDHQYYAVYTYEYGSAPSPPPCCDVTVTSSSSPSCCPYCETCPQCVAASSEL